MIKNKIIRKTAYAKINLYLDVLDKRKDGYHNILSVMQTVSLSDRISVELADENTYMTCTDSSLECGETNLCIKAARAFIQRVNKKMNVKMHLEKNIPREAGLGGGSADAAAVLNALNELIGMPLDYSELCKLGKSLGADVPFCIAGGTATAQGIGDFLTELSPIPKCFFVICEGIGRVSTPEAYKIIDSVPPSGKGNFDLLKKGIENSDLSIICKGLYNRFEDAVPSAITVKNIFVNQEAEGTLMSGSGSSVFGVFTNKNKAKNACAALNNAGLKAFLCEPVFP